MRIDPENKQSLYLQIVDDIGREIRDGVRAPGSKLPTVLEMSEERGIARGTVKHAYDELERQGLIEKTQGRGTFVKEEDPSAPGRKEQAMRAIDALLNTLAALSFSHKEMRIFLDLKMREREKSIAPLHVGIIDCNIEALSVIARQLKALNLDVHEYLLDALPEDISSARMDLWVTTTSHYDAMRDYLKQDPLRLSLSLSPETAAAISRLPNARRVGILSASRRFGNLIEKALPRYCDLDRAPLRALFDDVPKDFLERVDFLILPPDYSLFARPALLADMRALPHITYDYRIDRGSLVYLEDMVEKKRQSRAR